MTIDENSSTVERRTLSEQVYQYVRREILTERLRPGSELNEVALAETLGVSRGPIREAMGRLRAEKLVEVRPRRRAVVTSLSKEEFEEAYQVRRALEVLAVKLGTPKISSDGLEKIERLVDQLDQLARDADEERFFQVNRELHRAICEQSGNWTLLEVYDQLMDRMARYSHRSARLRGSLTSSTAEHRAILMAMRNGDPEEAGRLMDLHIGKPLEGLTELSEGAWGELSSMTLRSGRAIRESGPDDA